MQRISKRRCPAALGRMQASIRIAAPSPVRGVLPARRIIDRSSWSFGLLNGNGVVPKQSLFFPWKRAALGSIFQRAP